MNSDMKWLFLTEEQINGENPAEAAWDAVLAHLAGFDGEERTRHIRLLPQHWRAVYTGFRLQNEMNNGGFHQYFWNSSGALSSETLEDLRMVSAGSHVLLFEEAWDECRGHDYREEKARAGNSWDAFSKAYKEQRMADLDKAFCNAPKTVALHLSDYIRQNRSKYCFKFHFPTGAGNGRGILRD